MLLLTVPAPLLCFCASLLPAAAAANHHCLQQILWAVCVYLEAVSVLPQLRMMQNSKVVERFTAHYVFCLGLSRFFSCAHWILQVGGDDGVAGRSGAGSSSSSKTRGVPACF